MILPGIEIVGLSLYIRNEDTLVFGDLHLGYEEELNRMGLLVPRFQYDDILRHLEGVFSRIGKERIKRAVINGDVKHEFGRISEQEWREVLDFLDYLSGRCEEIILVRGNHDTVLGPIAEKRDVKAVDDFFMPDEGVFITHGHRMPVGKEFKESKIVIIGHEHPALFLRDGARTEKVKCFLKGKYKKKELIQIPSLSFASEGSDLAQEVAFSPMIKGSKGDFTAYCVEDYRVFCFGKLKNIE